MFEDEKIRRAHARQADERLVVILDRASHLFAIRQPHAYLHRAFDQALQIPRFFKRLFRRARRLPALLCRKLFSYR